MRRAARRDSTERDIVATLRKLGWSVEFLNLPDGPDLLLGRYGRTNLVEVKTRTGKLKVGQQRWHDEWRGSKVIVLRSVEEAIDFHHACDLIARIA